MEPDFGRRPKAKPFGREGMVGGFKGVLCSDGESRTAVGTDEDVEFLGVWNRLYLVRVWDYQSNGFTVVQGVLRVTDDDDRLFVQLPDQGWNLPDWTPEVLSSAHGRVMDRHGMVDYAFLHVTVR